MVDYLIYRDNSKNNIIDEKNISKENFQVKRGGGKPRHSYIDQIQEKIGGRNVLGGQGNGS